jgi:hypothetical protein
MDTHSSEAVQAGGLGSLSNFRERSLTGRVLLPSPQAGRQDIAKFGVVYVTYFSATATKQKEGQPFRADLLVFY